MATLRKIVGNAPLLQCGASVILINERGELLLQKRHDNSCCGFHGGGVELYEAVEDAACRELLEETGLTATSLELFGVFSSPELSYIYPNGDEVSNIDIVFLCHEYTGELKPQSDEVRELCFFATLDLPADISPPQKPVLQRYLERYGTGATPARR